MSKHTPGPWHYRKCPCNMPQCRIYTVSVTDQTEVTEFKEADARLAAAAPELLQSLQEVVQYFDAPGDGCFSDTQLAKARAAIAKATGGEG